MLVALFSFVVFGAYADDENDESNACLFDGCYFALGASFGSLENGGYKEHGGSKVRMDKQSVDSAKGVTVFGGGKALGEMFYVGGEFLVDFGKSRIGDAKYGGRKDGSIRNRGIVPALAVRPGFTKGEYLFFAKLGASFPNVILRDASNKEVGTTSKPLCSIGIGIERSISKKFSGRFEIERVASCKKTFGESSIESSGWFNVRALIAYNVKI
jgi:hypothetical protein